jgi:DNA-binding transcriptional ArsR family regulator
VLVGPDTSRMAKSHASAAQLRQVLRLFALFGHPIRVIIFQRIARTPGTAGELAKHLPVSRTAIVQHLKLLESAGLVSAASEARRRVYRIRPKGLAPIARWLDQSGVNS